MEKSNNKRKNDLLFIKNIIVLILSALWRTSEILCKGKQLETALEPKLVTQ